MMKMKVILAGCVAMLMVLAMPAQADDRININTATVEQLQSVKGIGPKTAAAIVEYRETHGGFGDVDELIKVRGIGEKKLAKFREVLTVEDESDEHHKRDD